MLFNSLPFFFSFLLFFLFYFFSNTKNQNRLLFLFGILFYSYWNWKMSFLLLFSITANYFWAISPVRTRSPKLFLVAGLVFNLGLLSFFKYLGFFSEVFKDLLQIFSVQKSFSTFSILLPVGISFYTFHNISYLVEIYYRRIEPTKNFISFAVYDLFFPLLLSGPIERPNSLLPQIENKRILTQEKFLEGLLLFSFGVFKKAVISDSIAPYVDQVLNPNTNLESVSIYFTALLFAVQIYTDFSGYSDCARGLAKMIGFELMLNFQIPFLSSNPVDFWRRWHMSLSSWLRDYLYIPLGGNRISEWKQYRNVILVWFLGGLWHGATYGYTLWGIYCGLQIILYLVFKKYVLTKLFPDVSSANVNVSPEPTERILSFGRSILGALGTLLTVSVFAHGLLLFRVENFSHLQRLVQGYSFAIHQPIFILKILFLVLPVAILEILQVVRKSPDFTFFLKENLLIRVCSFTFFGLLYCFFSVMEKHEFFYFQF